MRKVKLIPMKTKMYKFGTMNILTNEKGEWVPQTKSEMNMEGFTFKNEKEIINAWKTNQKQLIRLRRRLIKVYDNGLEVDITPIIIDLTKDEE
jgi:hypothetical protein